ncbi:MAG TPA: hypothetical protein VJU82_09015, partial [Acidobacteriaceae bacterium]|nr:hypothetical protein [Acidobacteriaceae bacterium]
MSRSVNPSWLHLSAAVINWDQIGRLRGEASAAASLRGNPNAEALHLRWMVPKYIGLPRKPFTTWIFTGDVSLSILPYSGYTLSGGLHRLNMPQSMAILVFRLNLTSPGAFVWGFSAQGTLLTGAQSQGTTGIVALQIQNSAIDYVLIEGIGTVAEIYGIKSSDFANLPGWIAVETVGLPIDQTDFAGTSYSTADQGFISSPVTPKLAAERRLKVGAPRYGWFGTLPDGTAAPAYDPPTTPGLFSDFNATILPNIKTMLNSSAGPYADASFVIQQNIPTPQQAGGGASTSSQPSTATFAPLGILLLGCCSDPFNALGLGFGTAYSLDELKSILSRQKSNQATGANTTALAVTPEASIGKVHLNITAVMVVGDYDLSILGFDLTGEMANIVFIDGLQFAVTQAPQNLSAATLRLNPPLTVDAPYTATVDATWNRPAQVLPSQTIAASYAVARSAPSTTSALLNATRVGGGFMPWVGSLPIDGDTSSPVFFEDSYVERPASGNSLSYAVAAQDWFGIWSDWAETTAGIPAEPVSYASVSDAQWQITDKSSSPHPAILTVFFSWDWTTRTAQEVDLLIALQTLPDPTAPLPAVPPPPGVQYSLGGAYANITFTFGTDPTVPPSVPGGAAYTVEIVPFTPPTPPDGTPPPPMPSNINVVQYKATIPGFSLNFGTADEAAAFIYARSKERVSSSWTTTAKPRVARLKSPTPPPVPTVDTIVWATLQDAQGVSRVHLRWNSNGAPPSASFHIYEATETGLLDVAGMPPADLTKPYAERLAALRTLDMAKCRKTFRKLTVPVAPYTSTDVEVTLPRGGRIIYAYVVASVSANNVESA